MEDLSKRTKNLKSTSRASRFDGFPAIPLGRQFNCRPNWRLPPQLAYCRLDETHHSEQSGADGAAFMVTFAGPAVGLQGLPSQKARSFSTYLPGSAGVARVMSWLDRPRWLPDSLAALATLTPEAAAPGSPTASQASVSFPFTAVVS